MLRVYDQFTLHPRLQLSQKCQLMRKSCNVTNGKAKAFIKLDMIVMLAHLLSNQIKTNNQESDSLKQQKVEVDPLGRQEAPS